MARFLKIVGGLLVFLIVVAVTLPLVVPADALKAQIITQMQTATGRQVSLGHVRLSLFPTFALKAENVAISNPDWAGGGNLAEIKMLHLGVEIIPLLHKKVDLTDVTLEDPIIILMKKGGQANWEFTPANTPKSVAQTTTKSASAENPAAALASLSLGSISITNGTVSYKDYDSGTTSAVSDVNLKLKAPSFSDKLTLDTTATYQNNKLTLSFTMAKLLDALQGVPSDATLKFEFGPLAFSWEGTFAMKNGVPALKGTLDIPEINAEKFKEFKTQNASTSATPSQTGGSAPSSGHWSTAPVDLHPLSLANADLVVTLSKLVLTQTTLTDIKAHILLGASKPGELLSITTDNISAYSGTVQSTIVISAPETVNISASVDKVNAGKLLHDFAQVDSLTGTLATHVNLTASGHSEREMVDSLAGKGDFQVKDGEIKGVDILSMAKGITSAFQNSDKNTKFSNLSGTFVAKAGVITNNDLSLLSEIMRVGGEGSANLPSWRVNYLLKPILASALTVPIRIEGALDSPSYRPDLKATLQENLKDPAAVQNAVKDLKGINSDTLKGLLR